MDQAAIRFCAMKVAAVAGDIRKALDICRRAVEMVEVEVKKQQVLKPPTSEYFLAVHQPFLVLFSTTPVLRFETSSNLSVLVPQIVSVINSILCCFYSALAQNAELV